MKFLYLFIALGVFFCYSSISSTVDTFAAEEKSPAPHCHVVSGNDSGYSNTKTSFNGNLNSPQDKNSSSCCLLSLLNSKDIEKNLQFAQVFTTVDHYVEKQSIRSFKKNNTYFDNGYSPPDIITLKSSFLI